MQCLEQFLPKLENFTLSRKAQILLSTLYGYNNAAGNAAWNAAWNATWNAAGNAAEIAAGNAAWNAAGNAAGKAAGKAALNAAWKAAGNAALSAAGNAAENAAGNAARLVFLAKSNQVLQEMLESLAGASFIEIDLETKAKWTALKEQYFGKAGEYPQLEVWLNAIDSLYDEKES